MDLTNVAGFALIGSILAFFNQVKAGVYRVFSVFIRTDKIDHNYVQQEAIRAILAESRIIRWGNVEWASQGWTRSAVYEVEVPVIARKEKALVLLWRFWAPLILRATERGFSVTYLWGTFDSRTLLERAFDQRARQDAGTFKRYGGYYVSDTSGEDVHLHAASTAVRAEETPVADPEHSFYYTHLRDHTDYLCHKYAQLSGQNTSTETILAYYWSPEARRLRDEVGYWLSNGEWFRARSIPQRRSALISGQPGGGKSKMVLEVARHFEIPVQRINLANMTDNEFRRAYNNLPSSHCIVLIEDLCAIFHGRTNVLAANSHMKNLLSFDTLLNVIGGVNPHGGIFLIVTANHPEQLDPALVRPGRLDVHIKVGPLDEQGKRIIASNILQGYPQLIEEAVHNSGENVTAAAMENRAIEMALKEFYKGR